MSRKLTQHETIQVPILPGIRWKFLTKIGISEEALLAIVLFQGKFNARVTQAAHKLAAQPLDCFAASFNTALELAGEFYSLLMSSLVSILTTSLKRVCWQYRSEGIQLQ